MLYIHVPNVLLFLCFYIILQWSFLFSLLSALISYIVLSIFLLLNNQLYIFHDSLDKVFLFNSIEIGINNTFTFIFNSLNQLNTFKKYYLQFKVIILLNTFKLIAYITPEKKENKLENNLQNDYLEILNRNKNRPKVKEEDTQEHELQEHELHENIATMD